MQLVYEINLEVLINNAMVSDNDGDDDGGAHKFNNDKKQQLI